MRQVGDTLVWFGLMLVVAAVIYFTPRLANYVTAATTERGRTPESVHSMVLAPDDAIEPGL